MEILKNSLVKCVLSVFVVIAIAITSYGVYSWKVDKANKEASDQYTDFRKKINYYKYKEANNVLLAMQKYHPKSQYTSIAGLALAKHLILQHNTKDYDKALGILSWVYAHSTDLMHDLSTVSYAAALTDSGEYKKAEEILNIKPNYKESNILLANQLGDLYLVESKLDKANSEYKEAYNIFNRTKLNNKSNYRIHQYDSFMRTKIIMTGGF